jgi:glutaconate CoA-transferase, subunit B
MCGCPEPEARPEIAASCGEVFAVIRQSRRSFVEKVDFVTSAGHGRGPGDRQRLSLRGSGPTLVITDLGVLLLHPHSRELTLSALPPSVTVDAVAMPPAGR